MCSFIWANEQIDYWYMNDVLKRAYAADQL